jgi:hypothetical protein
MLLSPRDSLDKRPQAEKNGKEKEKEKEKENAIVKGQTGGF